MTTSVVGLRCQRQHSELGHIREGDSELGHIGTEGGHACGELGRLLLCLGKCGPLALFCSEGVLVALCLGKCSPSGYFLGKSILKALYLGKVELRGCCGGLLATVFCSRVRQRFHLGGCRLSAFFLNCRLGLMVPLVSLIGDGLCSRGSCLLTLLLCLQRTRAAFLLVLHAGKCSLTPQLPRGLASAPGKEALVADQQEDDLGSRRLLCLSGALATSRLLVKEVLATCSLPLMFEGGVLVKKTLSCTSGLLAGSLLPACTSGVLVKEPLAAGSLFLALVEELLAAGSLFLAGARGLLNEECLVLVRPQILDGRLPIPVGAVRASTSPMKNRPSTSPRRQQSGSLLVFADGSLMPFFVAKWSTNVGWGVVAFVVVEQPLGGAWGGL